MQDMILGVSADAIKHDKIETEESVINTYYPYKEPMQVIFLSNQKNRS